MTYKILMLDIETAPNIAYVWRFFKENIGANQILQDCSILSFAAKWLNEKDVFYYAVENMSEKQLLKKLNELLDVADATVTHNGASFDMPKIRGRSLKYGLALPSPYKEIDTYLIARKEFGFDANSLEYLARILGCTLKYKHAKFPGFELWLECLRNNPAAWAEMKKYNIQDIHSLEQLYLKVRPYARTHPNVAVYIESDKQLCPKCGSDKLKKHANGSKFKWAYTNVGKYRGYTCGECGGHYRGRFTEYPKGKAKSLMVNAV